MSTPWSIVAFVLVLGFLVFIHELGHFVTAKRRGVQVLEFGIGFPPRIFGIRRGDTVYSINALPLGGFVKMLGEEDPSDPRSLASKGVGTRLLVLGAGSVLMLLFPVLLFSIVFMLPRDVVVGGEGIEVKQVVIDSPAYAGGIRPGDEIRRIAGTAVHTFDDVKEVIAANLGAEITVSVIRQAAELEVEVTPRKEWPSTEGPLGVGLGWTRPITEKRAYPVWQAIPLGVRQSWQMVVLLKDGLASAVAGESPFAVTGIIGIGQATSEIAKQGILELLAWAAFLSMNLGIINLLPIPALDGGRIVFVLIEWARRGRRISPKTERLAHSIGFVILIGLVLVVSYYDVLRIVQGQSLLP